MTYPRVITNRFVARTVAVLLLIGGCSPTEDDPLQLEPLSIEAGCNPLASEHDCLFPYPSNFFLTANAAMPSGSVVSVPDNALPQKDVGGGIDLNHYFPIDGFSHLPTISAVFSESIDGSIFEDLDGDLAKSVSDDSPTLLIHAETGARVMHLTELDPVPKYANKRALMIRPMTRLENQTRYIVVMRYLKNSSGHFITPPEGFRRIRDGQAGGDPILEPIAKRFKTELFAPLKANGVERDTLQLAWDFTTGSMENISSDMVSVRTQLLAALKVTPPKVEITEVLNDVDESIGRKIVGTMQVPLFLDKEEAGAWVNRDESGAVVQNGMATVPFTIIVPKSLLSGEIAAPGRLVQFGHGFFGKRSEIEGDFVRKFANQIGAVVMAVEWWGMDNTDRGLVAEALYHHPETLMQFSERLYQGMANQIALTVAAKETMVDLDELKVDGKLVYDPEHVYFYGISQGHILGGTLAALSPHFERITLSVGGAGLSFIMMRSYNFILFLQVMNASVTDLLEQNKLIGLTQQVADRFDSVTFAPWVLNSPFDDTPADRQVLLQIGLGDSQVPNMASHIHARSLGIPLLVPAPREVVGLENVESPHAGSALVEFDYGIPAPLPGRVATPPEETNEVHDGVRNNPLGIEQIERFFNPAGRIEHTCDGPCDPT
ncbi:MAG TPA: hypothetical protein EYN06_04690 [Myxococcales bacterium]|nr:hypothetical protein [Myxococcales bacterium]